MREIVSFNDSWRFYKDESSCPLVVSLPHTWNNIDGQDGGNDFYRGCCLYEKDLDIGPVSEGQRVYIEFKGVNNICEVFVGEKLLFHHENGFSTFRVELTDYAGSSNKIRVYVDNRRTDYTYPQFADFTFFGGIYREVNLVYVSANHFALDDKSLYGVRTWTTVSDGSGTVKLSANVVGDGDIRYDLFDDEGFRVASATETEAEINIDSPHLWNGIEDPYLYTLRARILTDGVIEDEVSFKIGFRSYCMDPDKGFILNGKEYPLRGVCRHQDRENMGWAIGLKEHEEDISIIKEMGANTIRLAHYQHAQEFYDLCDKNGLVVWAEIPYISGHLPKGKTNTLAMMEELVLQNMHHASIVCWGLSNEISMFGLSEDVYDNHRRLNDLCHQLDPTRVTTIAELGALPTDDFLVGLPDIRSYNHYMGWYLGSVDQNAAWIEKFHSDHPDMAIGISEYGAEAILSLHSEEPKKGDYSEEYQACYHEKMIQCFIDHPYLWATHAWNMFDFAADRRDEGGCKGRNNKGLVTFDRKTRKDSFYAYKAWLSKDPFVYVNGKRFHDRARKEISVKVYSNQKKVDLYVNGVFQQSKDGERVFEFNVSLAEVGETVVMAKSGDLCDQSIFQYVAEPNPSYQLNEKKKGLANWFETSLNGAEYDKACFSIRDSIDEIFSNDEAKSFVTDYLEDCSRKIGISFDQIWNIVSSENSVKKAFSLMSMACLPHVDEDFMELNEKLKKIKK